MNISHYEPSKIKNVAFDLGLECIIRTTPLLAKTTLLRHGILEAGRIMSGTLKPKNQLQFSPPPGVIVDRNVFGQAFMGIFDRMLTNHLSKATLQRIGHDLIHGALVQGGQQTAIAQFIEEFNFYPPVTLTISPGKICNLQCTGCYANAGPAAEKLSWSTFDRIVTDAKEKWGVRFLVISGGEPLAYRSEGKGLLDIAEKHSDVFFLFFTNGTLIDEKTAQRMADLGNITPAISVEGWCARTDERRGAGVYNKIIAAMNRLRKAGVFFGISLTATRHNAEEILSDEFINYFFQKKGAFYGWIFQYMPIGRSYTLDLMPTPEQRLWMWKRTWQIVKSQKIFLADFWNHATVSNGCLAGGGANGGYMYIDWNGAVSPCVFVPYSPVNIKDIYANGGTLNDIWNEPFFKDIRTWQKEYTQSKGNWLTPCLNRDHHQLLRQLISQHEPEAIDENARQALLDPDYQSGLIQYGENYKKLAEPVWRERYLNKRD